MGDYGKIEIFTTYMHRKLIIKICFNLRFYIEKLKKSEKAKKIRKKTKIKINLSNKNKKWNSSIIFRNTKIF